MPVISASDVRKVYDHVAILDRVSLTVGTGERVGVVGNNGCGKSTLGRILAGVEEPDAGIVAIRRNADVAYLAQEPRFSPGETVREAVLSGLGAWNAAHTRYERALEGLNSGVDLDRWLAEQTAATEDIERAGGWERLYEARAILGRLGVNDLDTSVDTLSGGRRRAVGLAKVLLSAPALAILDEPTNHLDLTTIEWLEGYLRETYRGALVLITHDRYVLDRVVDRTVEIDRGASFSYNGGYASYLEAKAERIAHAERAESNRQNFLRQELAWLQRSPKARTGKSKSRTRRAHETLARTAPQAERTADLRLSPSRSGKTILEADGLSIIVAGTTLVRNFEFKLTPGERIGIVGPNGCGKTVLLRTLLGQLEPTAGSVRLGSNTRVAYLDQIHACLDETATIEENVAGGRSDLQIGGRSISVRSYLARFLFEPGAARRVVATLSGGERARVALAKILTSEANLLILDEPTNDLDVATLGALETMITEFKGTAIIVSHDRWFLDRLATSILAFTTQATLERFAGNYSQYRGKTDASKVQSAVAPSKPAESTPAAKSKPKTLSYAERMELDGLMQRIEDAEARVGKLETRLADPQTYSGGGARITSLLAELEAAKGQADALTERWEKLESKKTPRLVR